MNKGKYNTFHVESKAGSMFEAYYQNESGEVEQVYNGGDYGDMIDAVMEHAGINVCFTHAFPSDDPEEDEGRMKLRNDLLAKVK